MARGRDSPVIVGRKQDGFFGKPLTEFQKEPDKVFFVGFRGRALMKLSVAADGSDAAYAVERVDGDPVASELLDDGKAIVVAVEDEGWMSHDV